MPFVDAAIDEGVEDELVPEGEYDLTIRTCDVQKGKKNPDRNVIRALMSIDDADVTNAAPVMEFLACPTADDEPQTRRILARKIRRFCHLFGIAYENGGFDTDDAAGATGRCLVRQSEPDEDGEYDSRHELVMPRVAEDAEVPGASARRGRRRRS